MLVRLVVCKWLPRQRSLGLDQDGLSIASINEQRRWRECREKGQRRKGRREGETKEWHTSVFSNPSSVEDDEWDPPYRMSAVLGNKAWVRRLIHCYSSGIMEAAFVRSSILPCKSAWPCNHLHFVLLWSWFMYQLMSLLVTMLWVCLVGCTFMCHSTQSVCCCRNENCLICSDCNTKRATDLTQGCHFSCIKWSEKNMNNERRVGGWGTIELHPSELAVAIITHKQWLAVLIKAYPMRITELRCFAIPICKAWLRPSERWDLSFRCHQHQVKV